MDYPISDEEASDSDVKVSSPNKRKRNKLKEKPVLKSMISENQLDCIDSSAYDESIDSGDLWNEMAKMSQVDVKAKVDEVDTISDARQRKYGDKDRNANCNKDEISDISSDTKKRTRSERVQENSDVSDRSFRDSEQRFGKTNIGSKSQNKNQNSRVTNKTEKKTLKGANDGANSQISILDDLFEKTGTEVKSKRKPAPSKGKAAKDLSKSHKTKVEKADTQDSEKDGAQFKAVDEIFCSTDSDSEVHLETSTLKDDDHDCFDDPRKRKKWKQKPEKTEMSAVDKLISDSEADFNNLFAAGKMKRKERTSVKEKESSPVKSCDRSASLFSF